MFLKNERIKKYKKRYCGESLRFVDNGDKFLILFIIYK